jgi:tetratricopeptide (TPR) repeat protein
MLIALLLVACGTGLPSVPSLPGLPAADRSLATQDVSGWPELASAAPLSLGTSDGAAMELVSLVGRAVVEEPLAWTELHLTYSNPEPRVREGRFTINLPEGSDITRLAMKVGGAWQEGEVVERKQAQRIFEDFLHRRQDPALMEQAAGSQFSARVFPIAPRGQVELIVSYATAIEEPGDWRLPLQGLPPLRSVDVSAQVMRGAPKAGEVRQTDTIRLQKMDWVANEDLRLPGTIEEGPRTLRSGDWVVARVTPPIEAPAAPVRSLLVLIDSSASRAYDYAGDVRRVGALAASLSAGAGRDTPLLVYAFDQGLTPLFEGKAGDFSAGVEAQLLTRLPMGASDLAGALRQLATTPGPRVERALVISDGVRTLGDEGVPALREAAASLSARGVKRLDVLASGGLRDALGLDALVDSGLPEDGVVIDASASLTEVAERLTRATASDLKVDVAGAAWVWPESLDSAQPGEPVLVYAQLPASQPLQITIGGKAVTTALAAEGSPPLVERAAAAARVRRLSALSDEARSAKDDDTAEALKRQAISLSLEQRVLSPWTALLVLESWWDYQTYGIDPANLARVVSVGPAGLEVVDRRGTDGLANLGYEEERPTTTRSRDDRPRPSRSAGRSVDKDEAQVDLERREPAPPPKAAAPQQQQQDPVLGANKAADMPFADAATKEDLGGLLGDASAEAQGYGGLGTRGLGAGGGGGVGSAGEGLVGGKGESAVPADAAPAPEEEAKFEKTVPAKPMATSSAAQTVAAEPPLRRIQSSPPPPPPARAKPARIQPWSGAYADIQGLLAQGAGARALKMASAWREEAPGEVLAYLALADAFAANGQPGEARRAAGSLIDLYPSRADIRRAAGDKLASLQAADLAVDTYEKAAEQRPDHPTSLRALAWARVEAGDLSGAFEAILRAQSQSYRWQHEAGLRPVLREDAAVLGAVLIARDPARRAEVVAALGQHGIQPATGPSLRVILTWETDANDVDLHLTDRSGETAYFGHKTLRSGGELYRGVFDGYGPEAFTIQGQPSGFPYKLGAHYYRKGPMGYGLGRVQIIHFDGQGGIGLESRPYVIMADNAWIELGELRQVPAPLVLTAG